MATELASSTPIAVESYRAFFRSNRHFPTSTQCNHPFWLTLEEVERSKNMTLLASLKGLEANWNDNGAEPFNASLIDRCRRLIMMLKRQPQIFPTARQSIQFEYDGPEIFEHRVYMYQAMPGNGETETDIGELAINKAIDTFYE